MKTTLTAAIFILLCTGPVLGAPNHQQKRDTDSSDSDSSSAQDSDELCEVSEIEVQEDFDKERFQGKWYSIRWIPFTPLGSTPMLNDFVRVQTINDDNTAYDLMVAGRIPGAPTCFQNQGELFFTDTPGKMWTYTNATGTVMVVPIWVISTDYVSYTLIYGCLTENEEGLCESAHAAVWSRSQTLSSEADEIVKDSYDDLCLDGNDFLEFVQTNECLP